MNRTGLGPNKGGSASNIKLDSEFDINSQNGLTNKAITEFRNQVAPAPSYLSPIANLSSSETGVYEVGTSLAVALGLSFNQRDGGAATNFILRKNGSVLDQQANAFNFTDNIIVPRSTITYQSEVEYLQGPIKNNPDFGFPDDRGRIAAGSDLSPNRSITGRFKIWYAPVANISNNSAEVRSLANNIFDNANQITLNTGTTQKKFQVALPSTKTSAASLSAQDITNNVSYTYPLADVFNVQLPDGTTQEYRIYALEIDNAYPSNAQHVISL